MGRRTIVLIVAIALAAVAAFATARFLTQVEDDAREGLNEVTVFRAAVLIERDTTGEDASARIEAGTENELFLPENAIRNQQELDALLDGTVSRGPISKGQIVTSDLFTAAAEEVQTFSQLIDPGMQAIVIRPDEVRAVGGLLRPGDRVNVIGLIDFDRTSLISFLANPIGRELLGVSDLLDSYIRSIDLPPLPEGQSDLEQVEEILDELVRSLPPQQQIVITSLQEIEILSVGGLTRGGPTPVTADGDETPPENVEALGSQLITLEVTADQAERVVWLFSQAQPWLTLLPAEGAYEPFVSEGITIDEILGDLIERRTLEAIGADTGTP
ncbi:MAG: Flp pilus assembly protein CpaB [Acidimicrobiia bacterium]|nr:Flp pilus assembly protein CpaB [Acidimicrobiia bacterium]MDH3471423.1 Flp pilus assembly protein CpaB [Acidimicrobiia bacterium]